VVFLKHWEGYTNLKLYKSRSWNFGAASPRTASPIYWAGLNIVGNNDTILLKKTIIGGVCTDLQ
jgi:hypothetical protein